MKLAKLARTPKLTKLQLDSEDIIAEYSEPLEFWVYDRQPMNVFIKLAAVDGDVEGMFMVIKDMILDEKGKIILEDDQTLPMGVMITVVTEVVDFLGKTGAQTIQK